MSPEPDKASKFPFGRDLRVAILVIVFGVSAFGFYQYHKARFEAAPREGTLVVNINTATAEEINSVPGISPIQALQIASNRPYTSLEELDRIPGIERAQLDALRPYVSSTAKPSVVMKGADPWCIPLCIIADLLGPAPRAALAVEKRQAVATSAGAKKMS